MYRTPMKRRRSSSAYKRPAKRARTVSTVRNASPADIRYTTFRTTAIVTPLWGGITASQTANLANGASMYNNFTGSTINPKSLKVHLQMNRGSANDAVRVIFVQLLGGTTPTVVQLLDQNANFTAPLAGFNRGYKYMYKVLIDRLYSMTQDSTTGLVDTIYVGRKKLRPINFIPGGNVVSVGDIVGYFYGTSTMSATGTATMAYHTEITYAD